MPDLYTSRTLVGVVNDLYVPSTFISSTFFGTEVTFDTELIDFDKLIKGRTLAPFVSEVSPGEPGRSPGYATSSFKPAYSRMVDHIDPDRPFRRRPGERYLGDGATPAERSDAALAEILVEHQEALDLRIEWMAMQSLLAGKIVVVGRNYPMREIDFRRDPALTIILTGATRWGEPGVTPSLDLEDWAQLVGDTSGAQVTHVVMGLGAWRYLWRDPEFRDMLDNRRGTESRIELGPDSRPRYQFRGVSGTLEFWTYTAQYKDAAGAMQRFLPTNSILLLSTGLEGVQSFGATKNAKVRYRAARYVPTAFITDNPALEFAMTESAPLPVPVQVNAAAHITVR